MEPKRQVVIFLSAMVLSFAQTALAQKDAPGGGTANPLKGRDTLELEQERIEGTPQDINVNRQGVQKPTPDLSFPNQRLEITPAEIRHSPPIEPLKVEAAPLPKPKWEKLRGNYIKVGIGRFLTPMARLYFNNSRSSKLDWGAEIGHLSSSAGHVKYAGFSDNNVKLKGAYYTSKHVFSARVYFQHFAYHAYGDSSIYATEPANEDAISRRYVRFQTDVGLAKHFSPDGLNYDANLNLQAYSDKSGNSEFHANVTPNFSFNPMDSLTVALNGRLTAASIGRPQGLKGYGQFFIDLTPTVTYKIGLFKLKGGFRLNSFSAGDSSSLGFYPVARVEFNLMESMVVPFIGVDGRTHYNTRFDMMTRNPWIDPSARIRETKEKLNLYGGIGGAYEQFSYKAQVHYRAMQNAPVFFSAPTEGVYFGETVKQGAFMVLYEPDFKEYGLTIQGGYDYEQKYRFGGRIDYSVFSLQKLQYNFQVPSFTAQLYGGLTLAKKFSIGTELNAIGSRTMGFAANGRNIEAGFFLDVNLSLEYAFTKRFSIFAEFNNLLNSRYYRWNGYLERPLDFKFGATFGF